MEKHFINIKVFGRKFPTHVDKDEAAVIEKAAYLINEKMRSLKSEYRVQEDLDIALMCCLDFVTHALKQEIALQKTEEDALNELEILHQKLNHTLSMIQDQS